MAVDAWGFDSERQAKAHRLRRMRFRLSIVRSAAIIVLVVGVVAVGAASLRDAVASFRWPSWASTILFLVLLFLIFLAVELPFAYVGGHRWETTSGLSSQSFRGWAKDLAKSVGLGLGGSIVVGSVVLWLLSATPAWWWLVAWVLGVLVSAILGFLAPVLLVRLARFPLDPLRGELGLCFNVYHRWDPLGGGHGGVALPRGRVLDPRAALSATRTASVPFPGGPRGPILPRPDEGSDELHRRDG